MTGRSTDEPQDNSQDDALALLACASTYGGVPCAASTPMRRCVFLAGERALKVKRAVRFPFLDFSTLDKRKAACEAESRPTGLSRRNFTAASSRSRAGPTGASRSAATASRSNGRSRCSASTRRRRSITSPTQAGSITRMADALGAQRRGGACAGAGRSTPRPGSPRSPTISSRTTPRSRECPDAVSASRRRRAHAREPRRLRAPSSAADRRAAARGLVRRGHGDLHLGNIALIDGRPVPFDAIEFDPADRVRRRALRPRLPAHGPRRARARRRRPTSCSTAISPRPRRDEDLDALAALPFLMSMRAAIRAKVTAARPAVSAGSRTRRDRRDAATTYFDLATPLDRAAAAAARRGRRPVRHRQIAARPRACARSAAASRRRRAALRRRAQGAVRRRRDRSPAGRSLYAGRHGARPMPRSPTRPAASSRPAIRRSSTPYSPTPPSAMPSPTSPARTACAFAGLFLTADLATRIARIGHRTGDASDADAAVARRQEDYALGSLDWSLRRRFRHAGGDAREGEGCVAGFLLNGLVLGAADGRVSKDGHGAAVLVAILRDGASRLLRMRSFT